MRQPIAHLGWRLAGVALLAAVVVAYDPNAGDLQNRLLLPLLMAVATWMMVQNLAAVALGACLLASIHSDPASADWILGRVYPGLAALAGVLLMVIVARRFHRRILETREARWGPRRSTQKGTSPEPPREAS